MQDEREKASELMKSGKYYDEALKWYNSRYITPKSQLAIIAFLSLLAMLTVIVSISTTLSIFPLSKKEGLSIHRTFDFNEHLALNEIGKKGQNASISYLEFMLGKYVEAREEYDPRKIDSNFNFVIELSDDQIFVDYLAIADPNQNPNHPVWQYGSRAIKDIAVTKKSLKGLHPQLQNHDTAKEYSASIKFQSTLFFSDNAQANEKLVADIKFIFTPIEVNQETNEIKELPKVVVTDYKTRKL